MTRRLSLRIVGPVVIAFAAIAGTALAQYGDPGRYDGYYQYDPAHETVERARSFGYHDGLADGERDRETGHSFRPTHSDRYEDAPDHGNHAGLRRDEFKSIYREAYLHGYERGYGRGYDRY